MRVSRRNRLVLPVAVATLLGVGAALLPAGAAPSPTADRDQAVSFDMFRHFSSLMGPERTTPGAVPVIEVLSNRADLISGGDALVEVVPPRGVKPSAVRVTVGGRDVTKAFGVRRTDGKFVGLITGMKVGRNVVTATAGGRAAKLTITNHHSGGPVFAGKQVQPWFCNTEAAGFGKPRDNDCTVPAKYDWLYKSTNPVQSGLQPYDPKNPPAADAIATTTTDAGKTVPFIVRRERGVVDRGWYAFASLYDPSKPWTPQNPQQGWNRKVYYTFGGGCSGSHYQGDPVTVSDADKLGKGWGLATGSLQVMGNNCNLTVLAESVMMQEERIQEQYGEIRYVVGNGCSGGAMAQNQMANAYPGLLHGLTHSCTFTDGDFSGQAVYHITLFNKYFTTPGLGLTWTEPEKSAAMGLFTGAAYSAGEMVVAPGQANPQNPTSCGADGPQPWIWNPETKKGVRCGWQDFRVAVYGYRSDKDAKRARRPWANEGTQYGYRGLLTGTISPEKFVDLNYHMGGLGIDGELSAVDPNRKGAAPRTSGTDNDNADVFKTLYETGGQNDARQLDLVPSINTQAWSGELEFHGAYQSFRLRERMIRANGHADNLVMLRHMGALDQDPVGGSMALAFQLIDQWLAAIEDDFTKNDKENRALRSKPLDVRVVQNKPPAAYNSCYVGPKRTADDRYCRDLYRYNGDIETASGQDIASMVMKCQLRPLDWSEYESYGINFTDDQKARLKEAFPNGVCDYRKPGIGLTKSVPWLDFGDRIDDRRPLGPPPASTPVR